MTPGLELGFIPKWPRRSPAEKGSVTAPHLHQVTGGPLCPTASIGLYRWPLNPWKQASQPGQAWCGGKASTLSEPGHSLLPCPQGHLVRRLNKHH